MTDGEARSIRGWIDAQHPPVPPVFRPHLEVASEVSADGEASVAGEVSVAALLDAAASAMRSCAERSPRDRAAAFSLLAADAHVTYACLRVLQEGGGARELRHVALQIGKMEVKWRQNGGELGEDGSRKWR